MNTLYLVRAVLKEYSISYWLKKLSHQNIFAVVFSKLHLKSLLKYQQQIPIFDRIYDYVEWCKEDKMGINKLSIKEIDDYLAKKEEEYKIPSLSLALYADRYLIKTKEKFWKRHLAWIISFLENVLENGKIEFIIGEISNASDYLGYYIAKSKDIPYVYFEHARIPNHMSFVDIHGRRIGLEKKFNELKNRDFTLEEKGKVDNYLKEYMMNSDPGYMKYMSFMSVKKLFAMKSDESLTFRIKNWVSTYKEDKKYSPHISPSLKPKLEEKICKFTFPFKRLVYRHYFFPMSREKEKYLLFPLHFQPEAATMTFASLYLNQIEFIENLSKVIPVKYKLYVREHPSMFYKRSLRDYKKLSSLPNVRIISPDENMRELLMNCEGIITLTGTAGYEAIIYDKPVFVFGNVFYEIYDFAYKVTSFTEFQERIRILDQWDKFSSDRLDIRMKFVLAVLENAYPGNMNLHLYDESALREENLQTIAKSILDYLDDHTKNNTSKTKPYTEKW